MADNFTYTPGTGETGAADDIAGVKYARVKLTLGGDGVNEGDVASTNPMPVSMASAPLPSGAATAANQATIIGHIDGIETLLGTSNTNTGTIATNTTTLAGAVTAGKIQAEVTNTVAVSATNLDIRDLNSASDSVTVTGTVSIGGTVAATQSGVWNITNISGTVSLPTGAATAANQTTIIGHVDGIETLLGTTNTNTGNIATSTATLAGAVTAGKVQSEVTNTVTITGTVTANAGTNLNTSALALETTATDIKTSVQILDNIVYTEGDVDSTITGIPILWEDTGNTLASVSAAKPLPVSITGGGSGDGAILDGVSGSIKATVFDYTNANPLSVRLTDTSGDYVSVGGGTQYTEDAPAAANPTGTALNLIRADTLAGVTTADGDNLAARGTDKGEMYVKHVDAIPVTDNGGSLTVDGTVGVSGTVPVSNAGTFAVQAAQSGTWNITNISGTISLPTGASTLAEQQTQTTSLQLIDDVVATLGTTTYTEATTKAATIGAVRRDANTTLVNTTNEIAPLQVNATGELKVAQIQALPAGTNVIGHVITDSGSTTAVTGTVTISGAVTNAGTFAVQESGAALTALQLIDDTITAQGTALGTTKTSLVGASVTTAAPTFTTGQINQLSMTTSGGLRVDLGATSANATALKVDGSAVTQPVSGSVTANAGTNLNTSLLALESGGNLAGIATSTALIDDTITAQGTALGTTKTSLVGGSVTTAAPTFTTGQINQLSLTTSGALRVDLGATGANATAVKVDGSAVTQPVSGTVAVSGTVPVSNAGTFAVQAAQSGTWNVTNVSGTVSLPTGASTLAEQQTQTTSLQLIDDAIVADDAAFTPAATKVAMTGFFFDDVSPDSVNEGDAGAARMSANRNIYTTLRDAAGNERGANVSAGNALLVDGSATTQPISMANALPAGTNAIGKLAANSGVDIGDIDVTSVIAGTGATNLGKAEDAAHTTGDTGVMTLAVRAAAPTDRSAGPTDGDYEPLGVNEVGALWTTPTASANGGTTIFRSIDLDETEEEVKGTAGVVYGYYFFNAAASVRYLKLYNATAASVTVGTTTPVMTIPMPAGAGANVGFTYGIGFATAICAAATTGVADADTGAPAANDVIVNIFYK